MAKVKVQNVCVKVGQTPRSKGQIWWYPQKGLVTRNTHVKYECHSSTKSKVMSKVKVFVGKQTNRKTERQTERQTDRTKTIYH